MRRLLLLSVFGSLFVPAAWAQPNPPTAEQLQFFEKNVRPVLMTQCAGCHGTKSKMTFGGLKVDSKAAFFQGGQSGPLVVPGKPAESRLLEVVQYGGQLKMPPSGKLKPEQIEALTEWVRMGAPWPDEASTIPAADLAARKKIDDERRHHWAWQPLSKPALPAGEPIRGFLEARLREKGLVLSAPADPRTLLRRLSFDLSGLPPTSAEMTAFLADPSPAAYERTVDRLLASTRFGERWGRHWLDLTYFADNLEIGRKIPAKEAWRYRDWVIAAFNRDKPYLQFIREQIAGDLLPADTDEQRREQLIATGFLALGPWALVAADKEQLRMDVVDMQVDLIGKAFLGLTLGCARCHDHKFDPIPAKDYYALAGILGSTVTLDGRIDGVFSDVHRTLLPETPAEMRDRAVATEKYLVRLAEARALVKKLTAEKDAISADNKDARKDAEKRLADAAKVVSYLEYLRPEPPSAFSVKDIDTPANAHINIRGNAHMLGEEVPRSFVQVAMWSGPPQLSYRASGRLELADWIASEKNPLTARVMVNRIWQHLFGYGLARSVDNVGLRGETPTHPELLDYLAGRLSAQGWSVKKMVREIVLSTAYQQSSAHDAKAYEADPENRLLWRMNRRRLEGETIRDAVLAITGTLDPTPGGPTLPLDLPDNLNLGKPVEFKDSAKLPDDLLLRRTVYLPVLRKSQHRSLDILNLFDFPDVNQVNGARSVTTVPTQALYLINSPFFQQQARLLADRSKEAAIDESARLAWLSERVLGRPAHREDLRRAHEFLAGFEATFSGEGKPAAEASAEAWARYAHALLVSNEFLYLK